MEIRCVTNSLAVLPKKLKKYAFTQDENGQVDLTIGRKYKIFGYMKQGDMERVLVLTDTIHANTPWWMPVEFFGVSKEVIKSLPKHWLSKKFGRVNKQIVIAPELYFGHELSIEDATDEGIEVFNIIRLREQHGAKRTDLLKTKNML